MATPTPDSIERVRQQIVNVLPEGSVLTLSLGLDNVVNLDLIFIKPEFKGQGFADQALELLCEHADAHRWTLSLVPADSFGADVRRLRGWYRRWGFMGHNEMIREPK